jgi:hypothetical protein
MKNGYLPRSLSRHGESFGFEMHRANLFMTNDGSTLLCEDGFWPHQGHTRRE